MNKFWILRNYDMINRIIFHAQNILTGRLEFNGGFPAIFKKLSLLFV